MDHMELRQSLRNEYISNMQNIKLFRVVHLLVPTLTRAVQAVPGNPTTNVRATSGGLSMDIFLGPDHTIAQVMAPVLDILQHNDAFELSSVQDWPDCRTKDFVFRSTDLPGQPRVTVVVYMGGSKHCRLVDTGETRPVQKLVCDD